VEVRAPLRWVEEINFYIPKVELGGASPLTSFSNADTMGQSSTVYPFHIRHGGHQRPYKHIATKATIPNNASTTGTLPDKAGADAGMTDY